MNDRFEKGMEILNITNPEGIDEIFKKFEDIAPDIGRFVVEYPYSELYSRKEVDLKTRELCTVAALTALGHAQPQLKDHINSCINLGSKPREIIEIIMQMSAYAGFPTAINGISVAKEVFENRNLI